MCKVAACVVLAEMWSANLDLLQCRQDTMAVRQHSRDSAFSQWKPVYVWNCWLLAYVGKNVGVMMCANVNIRLLKRSLNAPVVLQSLPT